MIAAPAATGGSTRQRLREMLGVARRDELVLAGIAIIVLIGLVGGGVNLLVPLQLRENGVSAGEIGLLFSVASAVYTVVSAVVARLGTRSATLRVGGAAALLTGLSIVLVLASSSTLAAVAFILLRAPPWSTMDTIIYPLAAAGAHRSALGRGSVMGLADGRLGCSVDGRPSTRRRIADLFGARAAYALMIGCCAAVASGCSAHRSRRSRVDLDRLYGARDIGELKTEYDRIAPAYDAELVDGMGYRSPAAVTAVARRVLPSDARILDAGAGTGLLGVALADAGFTRLDALDLSPGMLAGRVAQECLPRPPRGAARRRARLPDRRVRRRSSRRACSPSGHAPVGVPRRACPDHALREGI